MTPPHRGRSRPECSDSNSGPPRGSCPGLGRPRPDRGPSHGGDAEEQRFINLTCGQRPPGRRRRAADPRRVVFTLVEGARNNRHRWTRRRRCGRDSLACGHRSNVRPTNRAGERRQARRYLERELGHFERYCGGTPEALPLLKEIAALKQNSDRSWDERTRKEMEFAAPKIGQDHFPAGSERAQHKMSVGRSSPVLARKPLAHQDSNQTIAGDSIVWPRLVAIAGCW